MKTELNQSKKQGIAVNLLLLVLIALFVISISMMWLKHKQYHLDGSSFSWIMSEQSMDYSTYKDTTMQSLTMDKDINQ